jgi:hypothetical protein
LTTAVNDFSFHNRINRSLQDEEHERTERPSPFARFKVQIIPAFQLDELPNARGKFQQKQITSLLVGGKDTENGLGKKKSE